MEAQIKAANTLGATTVENENRRRATRFRTFKGARIIVGNGYSVFDCIVRNLSATGAMLALGESLGVPTHFDLAMDAAKARRPCTVRWRDRAALGVSFDDADVAA